VSETPTTSPTGTGDAPSGSATAGGSGFAPLETTALSRYSIPGELSFIPDESKNDSKLEYRQESTRATLAKYLLWIFGGTVSLSFLLLIALAGISAFYRCVPEGNGQQTAPVATTTPSVQPPPAAAAQLPTQSLTEPGNRSGCPENKVFQSNSQLVKDLITFLITSQTGLLGTALGFYFGSRTNHAG
jgi:hypothetical protein